MASQVFIKRRLPTIIVLAVILAVIGFFVFQENQTGTTYLNHDPSVGYVGMEKCVGCHGDKHATFIHTGMGQSFGLATSEKSKAQFSKDHIVYDTSNNMYYYPYWKGGDLYIQEFRLNDLDTIHSIHQRIDFIVGSGQHTNSHIFKVNDFLFQAPLTYYVQEEKWDLPPGYENGNNSRFNRILNVECLSCHNAMPTMDAQSDNKFLSIGEGIDCERCHGPGELHVSERENGKGVDTKTEVDYTIVNPRKLSWQRQIDVCQRCHLQGLNLLKEGKSFTDFRPGMDLSDVFEIYLPKTEGGEGQFDMANHSARLQKSACFVESNKKQLSMTCLTCHNPHISVKQTGVGVYNSACNNCHKSQTCTEDEQILQANNNNCVSCHMPQKGTEDIPHVSVHDHYIRVPTGKEIAESEVNLIGLYAVNNASPSEYSLAKAYLEYWEKFDKNPFFLSKAKQILDQTEFNDLLVKYYYLKEEYDRLLTVSIEENDVNARTLFMIGFAHKKLDQTSLAQYYLEKASKGSPYDLQIQSYYLKSLVDFGKHSKALAIGESLEELFPKSGEIKRELAKANLLLGNLERGLSYANTASLLLPDDLEVWEVQMNAMLLTGNTDQAQKWARRIVDVQPNHDARKLLK